MRCSAASYARRVTRDGKPRVLVACDFHAKYATNLARGLADQGCAVMLLTRDHDLEFGGERGEGEPGALRRYAEEVLDGAGVHRELPGRLSDLARLRVAVVRRREVRRFRPDVVHLQEAIWNDPRLVLAAAPPQGRFAATIHDPRRHPGDTPDTPLQRVGRRTLIRRAGLIFVHSEALRDELVQEWAPPGRIAVVPHGTRMPAHKPVPAEPTVLCFGRQSHYKGVDVLLDALPQVWQAVPDARVVLTGAGELPAHPLLGDERVELRHGHVREEDVPDLFARARVVALPYRQASQSGVGSLAKTFGRSLVVSAVGGLPELVADGSGELVPPEDPGALAEALVRTLATPGSPRSGGGGRRRARRRRAGCGSASSRWPRIGSFSGSKHLRPLTLEP